MCFELLTTGVAWAWSSITAWDCEVLFLILVMPFLEIGPNLQNIWRFLDNYVATLDFKSQHFKFCWINYYYKLNQKLFRVILKYIKYLKALTFYSYLLIWGLSEKGINSSLTECDIEYAISFDSTSSELVVSFSSTKIKQFFVIIVYKEWSCCFNVYNELILRKIDCTTN